MNQVCYIIATIFGIIALYLLWFLSCSYRLLKQRKKQLSSEQFLKMKRKNRLRLAVIIAVLLSAAYNTVYWSALANGHNLALFSSGILSSKRISKNDYASAVAETEFEPNIINEKFTIWEKLLYNNLHFNSFTEWSASKSTNEDLRTVYERNIYQSNSLPTVSMSEIKRYVDMFYGTRLLPYTERTLEEVSSEIPSAEERQHCAPSLFVEEFILRVSGCDNSSDYECLYQTGRASDDAFKLLVNTADASLKEKLFFASMAVSCYELALRKADGKADPSCSFIEYRISEIYMHLYEHNCLKSDDETTTRSYGLHFLLSAEAHLKRARDAFDLNDTNCDIHIEQPYHEYYLAKVQHYLITVYECENEHMIEECMQHAECYAASPYAKDRCKTSCRDIMIKLEREY